MSTANTLSPIPAVIVTDAGDCIDVGPDAGDDEWSGAILSHHTTSTADAQLLTCRDND